jgi:hypothetical protein
LRITTLANTVPSATVVAAVPAIMYSSGRCGGGMSQRRHLASAATASRPPKATNTVRWNFSFTTPF